jgi:DNA-binding transcriptional ArsR family regulator
MSSAARTAEPRLPGKAAGERPDVDMDALGRVGTAHADETRRRILVALLDGPAFPADLALELGLSRANVSNHLACLRGCRLVRATPHGRRVHYELGHPRLASALADLASLAGPADGSPPPTGAR